MMLDAQITQGAGLHALAVRGGPRIVALTSHGDKAAELPLIWRLCQAWNELDYRLSVLDVTAAETERNPGLLQLLAQPGTTLPPLPQPLAWPIVPAARGWPRLQTAASQATRQLGDLFRDDDVLLVYATPESLVQVFPDQALGPVLTTAAPGSSVLEAYQALKLMLLNSQLRPTIVATVDNPLQPLEASHPGLTLQQCAQAFLGRCPDLLEIPEHGGDTQQMHSLALRLLETALPASTRPPRPDDPQRSH